MANRVAAVMQRSLGLSRIVDPTIVLPELRDMIVVPGELLAERPVAVDGVRTFEAGWD